MPDSKPSTHPQYTAPGVSLDSPPTDPSTLAFSHPKNYLGIPVAIADNRSTGALVTGYIVELAGQAKTGAHTLHLTTQHDTLTPLGQNVVEAFTDTYGSTNAALEQLDSWHGDHTRFIEAAPTLKQPTQEIFTTYPPTTALLHWLTDCGPCTLTEIAQHARDTDPATAHNVLFRTNTDTPPTNNELTSTDTYRSHTTFQLKSCLYHAGILTTPGHSTDTLDPETDRWAIDPDFGGGR